MFSIKIQILLIVLLAIFVIETVNVFFCVVYCMAIAQQHRMFTA